MVSLGLPSLPGFWLGFSEHAVAFDLPWIADTTSRRLLRIYAEPLPGQPPDVYCSRVIDSHIERELGGRLLPRGETDINERPDW